VLTDREGESLRELLSDVAEKDGPIASAFSLCPMRFGAGETWPLDGLMDEQAVTVNTTAAGGNASLMTIG
jgi:RHH-type transcriptional regulator, proline utilization regulon repressor / proline dehydrogenase / delta 1-pyrroline-5-carboxylate dehydrogenase